MSWVLQALFLRSRHLFCLLSTMSFVSNDNICHMTYEIYDKQDCVPKLPMPPNAKHIKDLSTCLMLSWAWKSTFWFWNKAEPFWLFRAEIIQICQFQAPQWVKREIVFFFTKQGGREIWANFLVKKQTISRFFL